ncbi:RNA polymerase sigma factor [Cohnella candidum]|uniref:Sigma-70 family RNA polymerase sigma factor n=1 Tax=Cohnella candidum TaxID=2674991 RepID=A0A3G3K336_9BACL|nr:sigma-70 family RNA polymerase sigma factor [Cohnella candidum]AYQ74780.1 sigma-70 family RNA polymerase sigma factor [Cohnella candidum]
MEERELIRQLKERNPSALERIIEIYTAYISTVVNNVIGHWMKTEDVEEVVADTFVLLWRNAAQVQESGTLKSYLATIARNQALKKLRSYNPRVHPLDDELEWIVDRNDFRSKTELRHALEWALSSMSDLDREIFLRYYFFMEKTASIAERLNTKEATVRSRLSRGRKYLKEKLIEGGYYENKSLGTV